jgi:hypothetical protein
MNFPGSVKNKFSSKTNLWQRLLIVLVPTHIAREATISTIVDITKLTPTLQTFLSRSLRRPSP